MSSSIKLIDYDPKWPILYEEEKASILGVVGDFIVDIQHIGSTAVPGLAAKPIIDIMMAIRRLALVENCIQPLQTIGYAYLGEYGIPGRHYFRKPPGDLEARTHHLHLVEKEGDFWERHILFRDFLRAQTGWRQGHGPYRNRGAGRRGRHVHHQSRTGRSDPREQGASAERTGAGHRGQQQERQRLYG